MAQVVESSDKIEIRGGAGWADKLLMVYDKVQIKTMVNSTTLSSPRIQTGYLRENPPENDRQRMFTEKRGYARDPIAIRGKPSYRGSISQSDYVLFSLSGIESNRRRFLAAFHVRVSPP